MGEEYYLQPPSNQLFYHFLANMMGCFSVGERIAWGYEKNLKLHLINSQLMVVLGPVILLSQFVYLYVNFSELTFDILGIIFSIIPATVLAIVNMFSARFKSYKRISYDFMSKIHLYNIYKENKSDFVKKKLITLERITRLTSYYLIFFYINGWMGWIGLTTANNIRHKELVLNHTVRLQTPLFQWMPFDYSYNYRNWAIVHSMNTYLNFCAIAAMMTFHSIMFMFIYNLIGHLHILKYSLKTYFTDDMSDIEVNAKLCKIVKYHNFIIEVFEDFQNAFGVNVLTNYLQNLLGNSVTLYQFMYGGKENMAIYLTMIMAFTGGPVLMSFVIEELRRQSDDLADAVYCVPWEKMSISNQKTVLIILQRSQLLMEFKVLGAMKAGVTPMMSILKTTFSYYVMLESTIEK